MNITFEDRIGITNRVYNETSAVGIPVLLNFDQATINVTVCRLNNISSCHSVIAGSYHATDHLDTFRPFYVFYTCLYINILVKPENLKSKKMTVLF